MLHRLRDAGNTVVVIEHNLDVIKTADWVIDLGPEGGDGGGRIVAAGTPEQVAGVAESHTGQYLRRVLTNTNVRTIVPPHEPEPDARPPRASGRARRSSTPGFHIVSKAGLEGLTIGTLAEATGMSKSGLFAHFGSREELILAVMDRGQQEFLKLVVNPALARPRGLPRLKALFVEWLGWTESADLPGGCPMIGGAIEFDDKPGVVRDALAAGQRAWIDTLTRATRQAIEQGQLAAGHRPGADFLRVVRHRAGGAPPPAPARLRKGALTRACRVRRADRTPRRLQPLPRARLRAASR